jgi:Right handed beta helix region/Dockerin type I domain/Chlamydia polymorphic membrane protein (Chlamydia_PMP) repeat
MSKSLIFLVILLLSQICSAATIYVPSGSANIQAGINAASEGDTVLVADGTYTGAGNRDISFNGKNIVVMSENGPDFSILDLEGSDSDPHRAFNFLNFETSSAELIGFTFKNGYGTVSHDHSEGGAMLIENSAPTIKGCVFADNTAGYQGGAVSCFDSEPTFINCTIVGNIADYGSGLYMNGATVVLENCIIAIGGYGSAVYCKNSSADFYCCNLFGNIGGNWESCASYQLGINGNISQNPYFCDYFNKNYHLEFTSPCSPYINTDCGLIGALGVKCGGGIVFPLATQVSFDPSESGNVVTSPEPEIIWEYLDTASTTQSAFEIEVGTDDDWSVAEMWNPGQLSSSDTSVLYSGTPLQDLTQYFVRIKVQNGTIWGDWTEANFMTHYGTTIRVPADLPTIQAGIDFAVNGDTVFVADGIYTGIGNRDIDFNGKSITLISENGPDFAIIDCEGSSLDPHRGFILIGNEDTTSIISGFTVRKGFGPKEGTHYQGGAVYCDGSSPLIMNCIFENNYGDYQGGAISAFSSSLIIRNCIFDGDSAQYGGAIYLNTLSNPRIENTIFKNNISERGGGAIFTQYGGSTLHLVKCVFYDNNAQNGGGIFRDIMTNVNITNCTFVRNSGGSGSNIYSAPGYITVLNNTIIAFGLGGEGLYADNNGLSISCCDIFGNAGGDWVGDVSSYLGTDGNISVDPFFCDTANADFHIQGYSQCSPLVNPECSLIGALDPGCDGEPIFPIAGYINYGPASVDHLVYLIEPEIFWSYIDTAVTSQTQYEIEVGSDEDWTVAEMWSSGPVSSSDTSVVYAGSPLTRSETYFVRIRVNNGTSWGIWQSDWFLLNSSFVALVPGYASTIQEGIDLTSTGDTVLVAAGTYTGPGNRDLDYGGRDIVVISEDGPEVTIIDCEGSQPEPHRAFDFITGETSAAILEGFTITNGYGQFMDGYYIGGAIYLDNTSPTINNCVFDQNNAETGGSIYCYTASPMFNDCEFTTNIATLQGGALASFFGTPTFNNCGFTGNSGGNKGGAIAGYESVSNMNICIFDNNSAQDGGAIHFDGYIGKRSATVSLESCLLYENIAQTNGGAVYFGANTAASLLNCTLSDNECDVGSGIYTNSSSLLIIDNCIITYGVSGEAIYCGEPGIPDISCCDIYGNDGGDWIGCIAGLDGVNNNFSDNPEFCNRIVDDYSLKGQTSPCLPDNNFCNQLIGALAAGCINYICGDTNCDVDVNVSDAVWLIGFIFVGGDPPCPGLQTGDVNCDGTVNVSDAVWIINYVFIGGNAPCDTDGDDIQDCY